MQDNMMRIYQKDFSYFAGPNLFYSEKILKEALQILILGRRSRGQHKKRTGSRIKKKLRK